MHGMRPIIEFMTFNFSMQVGVCGARVTLSNLWGEIWLRVCIVPSSRRPDVVPHVGVTLSAGDRPSTKS